MRTTIVLMTGKKQSGKDTSVLALKKHLSQTPSIDYRSYSFADPLKRFLINVFGLSYDQCYGTDEQKNTLTQIQWENIPLNEDVKIALFQELKKQSYNPKEYLSAREMMQIFGTNICRHMYTDCWATACLNNISHDKPRIAFITDCRFPNEILCFKKYDTIIFRLMRDNFKNRHISEIALDDFDFTIFPHFLKVENQNLSLDEKNEIVCNFFKLKTGL